MEAKKNDECICDDVFRVEHVECEPSLKHLCDARAAIRRGPTFVYDGQAISRSKASRLAVEILGNSEYPLFFGLDKIGIRNQQLVINICRKLNGVIDVGVGGDRAELQTLAREGAMRATMGEVLSKSDLILLINCRLWESHPRLFKLMQSQRLGEKIFWLGDFNQKQRFEHYFCVAPEQIESLLNVVESKLQPSQIRECKLAEIEIETCFAHSESVEADVQLLLDEMSRARNICIFYSTEGHGAEFSVLSDQVVSIAKHLNQNKRAYALEMHESACAVGANNTLTWSTGYPAAIDLSGQIPRSFGSEYSASEILARRECDAVLYFDEQTNHELESIARNHLNAIPQLAFTWSQANSTTGNGLIVNNLDIAADDFVRFDDLAFGLEGREQSLRLMDFLQEIEQML